MPLQRLVLLFASVAMLAAPAVYGADYFVDPNRGNDNFDGRAAVPGLPGSGPWQTLARVAAASFAPGDTLRLACGGVWNETLTVRGSGIPGQPVTVTGAAGGCATPPAIDGALAVPAHGWTAYQGNIYRARVPVDLIFDASDAAAASRWTQWSPAGNTRLVADSACPSGGTCLLLTTGTSSGLAISNNFAITGGADYDAAVRVRAAAGTVLKVTVRRGGPTYEPLAPVQWVTANGNWQDVAIAFRAAAGVPNARLDIEATAGGVRTHLRDARVARRLGSTTVHSVLVDGLSLRRAHHPNFAAGTFGESPYAPLASDGGNTVVDVGTLPLPAGASLMPGLRATVRTINWSIEDRDVIAVAGKRLTLSAPTQSPIRAGHGFFLTGALWMLDSPGEWFHDTAAGYVYLWMPDGEAPGARVSLATLNLAADVSGQVHVLLADTALRHARTGVQATGAADVSLAGVNLRELTDYGVFAENCVRCSVQESRIERTGLDAIDVRGALSTGFSLTDSSIVDSASRQRTDGWRALPRPARAAVYSIGPSTTVSRNRIVGTGNQAVFVGPDSMVAENYIGETCLRVNDCGAVHLNMIGARTTIATNVIENVRGDLTGLPGTPFAQTVGIYLDDRNAASRVEDNIVTGAEIGIQIHDGRDIVVTDNTLFGNRRYQIWLQEQTRIVRAAGDVFGNRIERNLLVPPTSGPALYLESELGDTADFATFSGNHYSALYGSRVIGTRSPTTAASHTLAEWQGAGFDFGARATAPAGYASFLAGTANLVPNGNLAAGLEGWTWWNLTAPLGIARLTSCPHACLELTAGNSPTLLSSPNFSVTAGQWYRVSFDAATSVHGQAINAVVRRGGGGSNGYEYLMPAAESYAGSTAWRRYAFTFQASKTVVAGNPATGDLGSRVDFERNQPGTSLRIARLEMVALTPAQAALQLRMPLNRGTTVTAVDCASIVTNPALCGMFVYFDDGLPVTWPAVLSPLTGRPAYTRDTTLIDSDGDGIADQQDACPATPAGQAVNARGCAISQ